MLPGSAAGQCVVYGYRTLVVAVELLCRVKLDEQKCGVREMRNCRRKKRKRVTGILFLQAGKAKAIRRAGRQRAKVDDSRLLSTGVRLHRVSLRHTVRGGPGGRSRQAISLR